MCSGAGSGDLQARVLLPLFAGLGERWWLPSYCRVSTDLALTPLEEDGGADLQLVYAEVCERLAGRAVAAAAARATH